MGMDHCWSVLSMCFFLWRCPFSFLWWTNLLVRFTQHAHYVFFQFILYRIVKTNTHLQNKILNINKQTNKTHIKPDSNIQWYKDTRQFNTPEFSIIYLLIVQANPGYHDGIAKGLDSTLPIKFMGAVTVTTICCMLQVNSRI